MNANSLKICFKVFLKRAFPLDLNDEKSLNDRIWEKTHSQFILMIKHDSWDEQSINFKMRKVTFHEQTSGARWLKAAFCKKR